MNELQSLTIVLQLIFLATSAIAPQLLAEEDHIQIDLNGSIDSLKERWHRINGYVRALIFIPIILLSGLPGMMLAGGWLAYVLGFLVMLFGGALNLSYHWIVFDYHLNHLRRLVDYIGKNAKTDRFLVKHPKAKTTAIFVSSAAYLIAVILFLISLR